MNLATATRVTKDATFVAVVDRHAVFGVARACFIDSSAP